MTRLYARNCEVRKIENKEAFDFLEKYHKQGAINSKVCYGLFYENELVQVETFGLPRIERQNGTIWHDWELYRECSKEDYYILGGKSKLLKAFEKDIKPLSLLSYCNTTEGFDGHSYKDCGFHLDSICKEYWYEYNGDKIQRYQMQKNSNLRALGKKEPIQKTLEKYGKTYNADLTERENAENAGFIVVEGRGQQTWSKYYSNDIGYIYAVTNILNGKKYVGQHTLVKNDKLKSKDYFASGTAIQAAVKKYGRKAFKREVLEWTTDLSNLSHLEYNWICIFEKEFGRENMYNLDFKENTASNGVWKQDEFKYTTSKERYKKSIRKYWDNMTDEERQKIRDSHKGQVAWNKGISPSKEQREKQSAKMKCRHLTEEQKRKISEALKGRKLSEEHKKNLSIAAKGKKMSEEARQKMSEAKKGRTFSLEARAKISATLKGKTKGKKCYTNGYINRYFKDGDEIPEGWVEGMTREGRWYVKL